jgi:hypothetical protein
VIIFAVCLACEAYMVSGRSEKRHRYVSGNLLLYSVRLREPTARALSLQGNAISGRYLEDESVRLKIRR